MNTTLIASSLALLAGAAQAQTPPDDMRMAQADRLIELRVAAPEALRFAGGELERERLVKGAPYCATAVHESIQTLADGNRIVKAQRTELCRDGEGRTRREIARDGGSRVVYLHDPVARESWVLQPDKKTARRLRSAWSGAVMERELHHEALGERLRDNAERWREWATDAARHAREGAREAHKQAEQAMKEARKHAGSGEPAVVVHEDVVVRHGQGEAQRHRDVRVIRLSDMPAMAPLPPLPPTPPMPPMALSWGGGFGLPREGGVTTALPPREIEGVKVHGERTTWTIEAGKIGNEKPIVSSREVWKSPELMLTVLSKDSDPRSGETSYRLEKIRRGEPDAALMKVPADYQQEQQRLPAPPAPPTAPKPPAKG